MIIVTIASNVFNIIAADRAVTSDRIEPKTDEWRLVRDRHAVIPRSADYVKSVPVPANTGTLAHLPRSRIRSPYKVSVRTPYDRHINLNLQ